MISNQIKRFLFPILGLSVRENALNIPKTLLFNYVILGWKGLLKRPVYIYNNCNIYHIGKVHFNCSLESGLLRIGQLDYKSQGKTKFDNIGIIDINGPVEIGGCSILENSGHIIFKGYNRIADGCYILIRDKFVIGEQSRIGFHSFIMDSDDHYTIDVETRRVNRNSKQIEIGDYNWIGNTTFIKKGVKTPNYLIVASSNALLTKDYTSLPSYSVIGGSPAKLLRENIRRIYNLEKEIELNLFFKTYSYEMFFQYNISDKELDDFCKQKDKKF